MTRASDNTGAARYRVLLANQFLNSQADSRPTRLAAAAAEARYRVSEEIRVFHPAFVMPLPTGLGRRD